VCTARTGLVHKSGEQLQPTIVAIWFPGLCSDFLLVMVGLSDQSWLYLCISFGWLLVFFWNHSLSRLRYSVVASAYGWVTILLYCLLVKQAHPLVSNRLWAHTIFGESNRWKIAWEDLLSYSCNCSQSLLQQRNPNAPVEAP
jgi:hypothetical protein